mmetsp:Transcript_2944/g.6432  ORF Transcript_2944/g.6432 Transcript_2944/m.6432 type:complete len:216 (-) Transcript_2944:111-758(-)
MVDGVHEAEEAGAHLLGAWNLLGLHQVKLLALCKIHEVGDEQPGSEMHARRHAVRFVQKGSAMHRCIDNLQRCAQRRDAHSEAEEPQVRDLQNRGDDEVRLEVLQYCQLALQRCLEVLLVPIADCISKLGEVSISHCPEENGILSDGLLHVATAAIHIQVKTLSKDHVIAVCRHLDNIASRLESKRERNVGLYVAARPFCCYEDAPSSAPAAPEH